jgi:HK97 family phage prohead protease
MTDIQENGAEMADAEPTLIVTNPAVETRSVANVDNVSLDERIITVIAVPYEQPTPVPFQNDIWNEVFTRSAFNGLDATKRRIPATACLQIPAPEHRGGQLVGRAHAFFPEREEGLVTDLKISRTPVGDETLELARDGNLSVSVGFYVKGRLDETLDRGRRERRINRAFLDHIAFVAQPAYSGAKVLGTRSDGSDGAPGRTDTPNLDSFLEDAIFQWANNRKTS